MPLHYFETSLKIPGLKLPARSTLVTGDRTRILISPIHFTPAQIETLRSQDSVTDIVAPNLFHHLFAHRAQKAFPHAALWCAPGLDTKRTDIRWKRTLTRETWPHREVLDLQNVRGVPAVNEVVFFHPETRTLIVTDLVFNLQNPRGWSSFALLRILGTHKKLSTSRLLNLWVRDRKAFRTSLETILKWDFDRIVMAHGSIVETGGRVLLEKVLREKSWIGS